MKLADLVKVHGGIVRIFEFDEYTCQLNEVYHGSMLLLINYPGEVIITYTTVNRGNDIGVLNINVKGCHHE